MAKEKKPKFFFSDHGLSVPDLLEQKEKENNQKKSETLFLFCVFFLILVSLVQKILAKNFLGSKNFFAKIYFRENRMQKTGDFHPNVKKKWQLSAYRNQDFNFSYAEN